MAQDDHKDTDHLSENWLNDFEEECIEELENEPNMEDNLRRERECAVQKLWLQFQNSATAIAELYKGIYFFAQNGCVYCYILNREYLSILVQRKFWKI